MAKLIRVGYGQKANNSHVIAIEWNEDDSFKESKGDRPIVGCSLYVGEGWVNYWLTTPVVEILEERENYIRFRTRNSVYELIDFEKQ